MVDASALDALLAGDRRVGGRGPALAHPWFAEEPSEQALEEYTEQRRSALNRLAAAAVTTSLSVAVVVLLLALPG